MTIHFQCPCGQKMKAEERKIGRTFSCPVCGEPVTVPATDQRPPRRSEPHSDSDGDAHADPDSGPLSDTELTDTAVASGPLSDTEIVSSFLSDTELVAASAPSNGAATTAAHEPDETPGGHTDPPPRQRELPAASSTTANAARDLFLRIGAKERQETLSGREAVRVQKEKKTSSFDLGGLLRDGGRALLPGAALTVGACLFAYWLASAVMGTNRGWPDLGEVSGVVKLDGQPLQGATVTFRPLTDDEKNANKISSSVGITDAEGRYTLKYVRDADGAAVGAHQVLIEAFLPNGAQQLPARYNVDTKLTAEVAPGSNTFDFLDLTTDKGTSRKK